MTSTPTSPGYLNATSVQSPFELIRVINMNSDILVSKRAFTFQQKIDDTARNIEYTPTTGAFLVVVQGIENELPTLISTCCKASAAVAGSITNLGSQAGAGTTWNAVTLTISSTASNFQIAHSLAVITGEFYITIIGVA